MGTLILKIEEKISHFLENPIVSLWEIFDSFGILEGFERGTLSQSKINGFSKKISGKRKHIELIDSKRVLLKFKN